MSALGQKQTFAVQKRMSALPRKRTCAVQLVCPLSANSGHQTLLCCLISRVTSLANNVAG